MKNILPPNSYFEPIHHTADVGYELYARSFKDLFAVAAFALFDAITELDSIEKKLTQQIEVKASDSEALLVAWLSELNFYCITGLELFCQFDIHTITETHLSATIHGEKINPARHEIETEIKAVTYHGLYLQERQDGWYAQVIFDV